MRRLLPIIAGFVSLAVFSLAGCSKESGFENIVGAADPKLAKEPVPPNLVAANTRFAFKLFRELAAQDVGKNLFISPASVSLALTMTYNGADGTTRTAMADALELGGMSLEEVNQANLVLLSNLAFGDEKVKLAIANSLWGRKDVRFNDGFLERNRRFFGAEVASLDFADPGALATINGWVSDHTNGKIKDILDRIPSDAILYLINAIYFKGTWTTEFDKSKTVDAPFTLLNGSRKTMPMMRQSGKYAYYRGDSFQAVSLPYGDEGRFSMYLFLPDANSSLAAFQESLSAENWERWMAGFHPMDGDIALPRFKVEYKTEMKDALIALGMGIAFSEDADFSEMFPPDAMRRAFISRVIHQSFVEVNEEGTEAAAATVVEITETAIPERFSMTIDRPFFCAIRDNTSGTVLFMGSIVDPQPPGSN